MYLRMTFFKVKDGTMGELRELYNREVIPAHKSHKGLRFVHLLESLDQRTDEWREDRSRSSTIGSWYGPRRPHNTEGS